MRYRDRPRRAAGRRVPAGPAVLVGLALAFAGAGCFGPDHTERTELPGPPPEDPARERMSPEVDQVLYGPDGVPLPSDTDVAGLPLPRGLELSREDDRNHVYFTEVPLTKVQQYFGPRLQTMEVERIGAGVIYKAAVPKGVRGGQVKMDVSILPASGGRTRVEVAELPPAPVVPDDPEARREMFERIQRETPVLD